MPLTITKATPADLPSVGELYGSVCDGLQGKPYNPGWSRGGFPTLENAQTYLEDGVLLLAWEDGKLAGSVGFTRNPSAEDGFENAPQRNDGIAYIHVMAVHPDFARRGISGKLLAEAGRLSKQSGIHTLRLYVWEGNTPAIRAYEKAGYACIQEGVDIGLSEFGLERFCLYEKSVSE